MKFDDKSKETVKQMQTNGTREKKILYVLIYAHTLFLAVFIIAWKMTIPIVAHCIAFYGLKLKIEAKVILEKDR